MSSETDNMAIVLEARLREFEAGMNGVSASIEKVVAATEAMERDYQLLFLQTMRAEIDEAISELSEAHSEARQ